MLTGGVKVAERPVLDGAAAVLLSSCHCRDARSRVLGACGWVGAVALLPTQRRYGASRRSVLLPAITLSKPKSGWASAAGTIHLVRSTTPYRQPSAGVTSRQVSDVELQRLSLPLLRSTSQPSPASPPVHLN